MNKLVIYDPPMCCSSGACGDVRIQYTISELQKAGIAVERYAVNHYPEKFEENAEVMTLINKHRFDILPITTFNETIVKTTDYPTLEECQKWCNNDLQPTPGASNEDKGCCSDKNYCDIRCSPKYNEGGNGCCDGSNSGCC